MTKTSHSIGQVTYGAAGRRWTFQAGDYSYATNRMPGGRVTADKIAGLINGGITRTKGHGIDNLARAIDMSARAAMASISPLR